MIDKKSFMAEFVAMVKEFESHQILEQMIPRQFDKGFTGLSEGDDFDGLTQSISKPLYDLLDRGGKRWRPALCFMITKMFGHDPKEVYVIAAFVELIHNGSIIIDDIQDQSDVRRSKPCIHLTYGIDTSINLGNFMYFAPLNYLIKSNKYDSQTLNDIVKTYAEVMTQGHIGQAWDINWHRWENDKIPTVEQYFSMAKSKSGILAKLVAKLTCIVLKQAAGDSLAEYAAKIGIAFQIQDDWLNIAGGEYSTTKGELGEDIHEGKLSLIVIHSLQTNRNQRLIDILKSKTHDQKVILEAIQILKSTNSLEFAQSESKRLIEEAWLDIKDQIPAEQSYRLQYFAQFLIERSH